MVENKGKIIVIVAFLMVAVVFSSGCINEPSNEQLEMESNLGLGNVRVGDSFYIEERFTEENQQRLLKSSPPPKLTTSLERENLIRRYEFLNDQNKIFYVYLISYGKVMGYYTAQGKISSVNSRLTQEDQIVDVENLGISSYESNDGLVVGSPQLDGSYGTNGDGIFFFTTEGAYVEWNGEYIVSDFPLKMSTPPILVKEVE